MLHVLLLYNFEFMSLCSHSLSFVLCNIRLNHNIHLFLHHLRNKTYVPMFYYRGAYELNHECASIRTSTRVLLRDKTRVHMFYFDSNTNVPLQCVALVFFLENVC